MSRKLHANNSSLRFLIDLWSRRCPLEPWHIDWAKTNIKTVSSLKKGENLYFEGESQKNIYLVTKGMLARIYRDVDTGKRQILSVALPGMALMTTSHLYSDRPSLGDLQVLTPGTAIAEIPYKAIKAFKEKEPQIDTLIDILSNKKKKQMMALRRIVCESEVSKRYLLFRKELPLLVRQLTQTEQAELLGISRATVQRLQYFILKGQRPQN